MENCFHHIIPIQLRMNDIDFMDHVNNAVIMEFFDLGKITYLKQFGLVASPETKSSLVVVRHEVDFFNQIRFEDSINVLTRADSFGSKSMRLWQEIRSETEMKAQCLSVLSGFDPLKNCSCIIPEELKEKIRLYEAEVGNCLIT